MTWQEYADESSKTKRREVERWVEQLINAVIAVAEIVLASRRNVIPETYRRMVLTLGTVPPFDEGDFCKKLSELLELRNVLAHDYLDYRWKEIRFFLDDTEPLWHDFIEKIKRFLSEEAKGE